jgi:nucleotide-binding universal stress UspA family protein
MRLPFETVLVTTDLSPIGDAALPVAFRLARDHGARLLLLSVVETPPAPNPLYAHYYPTPDEATVARDLAALRKALEQRVDPDVARGIAWEPRVAEGCPAAEIARAAAETNTSLLVMATHGRAGLKEFLLGSVAERVLKTTTCPVLLVR